MKKLIYCLPILLLMIFIGGCQIGKEQKELLKNSTKIQEQYPKAKSPRLLADRVMDNYIRGFNEINTELLIQTMHPQRRDYYPIERAMAAIKDHQRLFGAQPLKFVFTSTQIDFIENSYGYKVYNSDKEKNVVVVATNDAAYIVDLFLDYSYFAQLKIDSYIQALKHKNNDGLAHSLSEGDLHFPINETDRLIRDYESKIDLLSIDYELIDFKKDSFVYLIRGTKNGKPVNHHLNILCGDSMTGIRDLWVPLEHWKGKGSLEQ